MSSKKFKKDGFVYRVAFVAIPLEKRPDKVSLCVLFWSFWAGLAMSVFLYGFIVPCFTVIALMFGNRPTFFKDDPKGTAVVRFSWWPTILGYRILPIYGVVAYLGYLLTLVFIPKIQKLLSDLSFLIGLLWFWQVIFLLAGVWALHIWASKIAKSEPWTLLKAWLKARKQKYCPIIEFE